MHAVHCTAWKQKHTALDRRNTIQHTRSRRGTLPCSCACLLSFAFSFNTQALLHHGEPYCFAGMQSRVALSPPYNAVMLFSHIDHATGHHINLHNRSQCLSVLPQDGMTSIAASHRPLHQVFHQNCGLPDSTPPPKPTSTMVSSASRFCLMTAREVSQLRRNTPSTPHTPKPSTMSRVRRKGT